MTSFDDFPPFETRSANVCYRDLPDFKILLNRFPPTAVALIHAAKR
ncbi:hypothetical protein OCEANICA350_20100 [Oceanicaulis sp. 350]|nr:hypothetical protein OCEANICA350_20100 [Oceanicaulis sp. 350]